MRPSASSRHGSARSQEVETVALADADGRILAHDIAAPLPLPPFTNSAVDGYAVRKPRSAEGRGEHFLCRAACRPALRREMPIKPGHAVRIFTGAPMPEGADTVFMQEDVRLEGGKVVLPAGLKPGANVRPAGEDIPARPCRAEGRPAAAAAGCRAGRRVRADANRRGQAHPRRGVLDRQRTGVAGRGARGARNCSTPTASC